MERMCPCGKQVLPNRRLCQECGDIYGFNSAEWPEWLRFLVSDTQRQLDFDLKHNHLRLDDIEPNGSGGYRPKREFALRGCRTETHLYETEPTTRGLPADQGCQDDRHTKPAYVRS